MWRGMRSAGTSTTPSGKSPSPPIRRSYARRYDGAVAIDPPHTLLERAFPDAAEVHVEDRTGGGDHFQVTVRSRRFNGLPLLEQHRLANSALAEPLRGGTVHAPPITPRGTES